MHIVLDMNKPASPYVYYIFIWPKSQKTNQHVWITSYFRIIQTEMAVLDNKECK